MSYQQLMDKARALIKAHPGLQPEQYAAMLQHHLQDQPLSGWWILNELQGTTPPPEGQEHGG